MLISARVSFNPHGNLEKVHPALRLKKLIVRKIKYFSQRCTAKIFKIQTLVWPQSLGYKSLPIIQSHHFANKDSKGQSP